MRRSTTFLTCTHSQPLRSFFESTEWNRQLLRCSSNIRYGKVAAEASRGDKETNQAQTDRLSVDIPVPLTSSAIMGSRADRSRARQMTPLLVPVLAVLFISTPDPALPIFSQANDHALVVFRGRAVCLNASGSTLGRDEESLLGCSDENHHFGFETKSGKLYKFLPSDPMTPIFTDARVRQRELQISARPHAGDQLEIIAVQSIKEGKLYDVYYFCDVCNIKAYVPGLCPCCRAELQFRETPP